MDCRPRHLPTRIAGDLVSLIAPSAQGSDSAAFTRARSGRSLCDGTLTLQVVIAALVMLLVSSLAAARPDARLVAAVKAQDVAAVRLLLRHKVAVNATEGDGTTALHWAVRRNNRLITEALVAAGADVHATNDYGVTSLWLACSADGSIASALLSAHANPNAALTNGETVLMRCAYTGHTEAVRLLLAYGADVNARGGLRRQTALMWAVAQRHRDVVRVLIEGGAAVHARTIVRRQVVGTGLNGTGSPGGGPEGLSGMEISVGGFTPFMFAAQQGDLECARLLLAAGADINDTSADGASALVTASHSGHMAFTIFLLANGADPNRARCRLYGFAYSGAARQSRPGEGTVGARRRSECPCHKGIGGRSAVGSLVCARAVHRGHPVSAECQIR